jgi:hypothetical protein
VNAPRTALACALALAACSSPKDVEIKIDAPVEVRRGETFEIRATVQNTASKPQRLVSLDVGDRYLKGIAVVGTEPAFKSASHVPIDDTMSYTFDLPLPPGERRTVVFTARAVAAGDHASEVDFCINSETSFLSYPVRTIVVP